MHLAVPAVYYSSAPEQAGNKLTKMRKPTLASAQLAQSAKHSPSFIAGQIPGIRHLGSTCRALEFTYQSFPISLTRPCTPSGVRLARWELPMSFTSLDDQVSQHSTHTKQSNSLKILPLMSGRWCRLAFVVLWCCCQRAMTVCFTTPLPNSQQ